jgi:predicted PurR-regulated permease PerM
VRAKHWRLVSIIAGVGIVIVVLYLLRWVLLPSLLSFILAYILLPGVSWLEMRFSKTDRLHHSLRPMAIVIIYFVFGAVGSVLAFYIVNSLFHLIANLLLDLPQFYKDASAQVEKFIHPFISTLPEETVASIQVSIQSFIENAAGNLQKSILNIGSQFSSRMSSLAGLLALPFVVFYILKDYEKINRSFYSALPPSIKEHAKNIMAIVGKTLNAFMRTSLTLGVIVGCLNLIGLLILGVPMAPMLAVISGLTEMIVMIGPWIGGIIAVIVTLALAPEKAIWVGVLFLVVQILENNFIVPRVQSHYFNIHPILTVMLLIIGTFLFGFWGLLLAVPLATIIIQIYQYIRRINRKSPLIDSSI